MSVEDFSENLAAGMEKRWDISDDSIATNVVLENISLDTSPETFLPLEEGETLQSAISSMVSSLTTEDGLNAYIQDGLEMAASENTLSEWGIGSGYSDVESFAKDVDLQAVILAIKEAWQLSI